MTTLRGEKAESLLALPGEATLTSRNTLVGHEGRRVVSAYRAAVWLLGFAALAVILYFVSLYTGAADSDKATTILVGQSLAGGNLLLRGWTLSPANYWTSDAALYALAVRAFGVGPWLLYAEPAVVGAATIAVGAAIAREGRRGSAAVVGVATVAVLLVFAVPPMAIWFVGKSFHILTTLYALVAFWLLRSGRFGWRWTLGVLLLAFCLLGDALIAPYAMAPLFVGGLVAMARLRNVRAGGPQVTAALGSALLGEVVLRLAHALGAFQLGSPLPYAKFSQMVVNVGHVFTYGADLLGLTNGARFGTAGVPVALLEVHAIGAACVVGCVLLALWRMLVGVARGPGSHDIDAGSVAAWRLDDLLVLATLIGVVPFIALAGPNGVAVHLLALPVLFASVLTGRILARGWSALRPAWRRPGAIVGLAVCLGFGAGLAYQFSEPEPVNAAGTLATWLAGHHLNSGIGGYWDAALTTVYSHDAVRIAPVTVGHHGIQRLGFQSEDSSYSGKDFQFYVFGASNKADLTAARRMWGTPAHDYLLGDSRVLTWSHPLRVPAHPAPRVASR